MLQRIVAIAVNTFTESVRQPVYGIILFSSLVLICLSPAFSMFSMTEDVKIMTDTGLATIFLAGLLLAAFSASGVIWREIESKTVLTVVTRPVRTLEFILAKFGGIILSLATAMYLLTLVFILMIRIGVPETASFELDRAVTLGLLGSLLLSIIIGGCANYFFNKHFVSTTITVAVCLITAAFAVLCFFDKNFALQSFGADINRELAKACILLWFAVFILGAVATVLSTRLGIVMNMVTCMVIFILGLLSDHILGELAYTNVLARIAYAVLPNLQFFWLADALTMESIIPWSYVVNVIGYAVFYQAAIICLGTLVFSSRELS
ncbi:hypothetical protein KAW55_04005 [bacterium]|nr:hypothetical protein [bacterium]